MTTAETLAALLGKIEVLQEAIAPATKQAKSTNWHLQFTEKEVNQMPKTFRKTFRIEGCTVQCRKREDGRHRNSYEIRYRRNGYNLSVSATDLQTVKKRFIEVLHIADKNGGKLPTITVPTTFNAFARFYFERFRSRKVKPKTLKNDINRYDNHILPRFGETPVQRITPADIQALADSLGACKTCHECISLLRQIFNSAVDHHIIRYNPCDTVIVDDYEQENGVALTPEEVRKLVHDSAATGYQADFVGILCTGVRPNEYTSVKLDGNDFVVAINSKQKDGKVRYKRIAICPTLRPYITPDFHITSPNTLKRHLKRILPNHTLKDLRTTFYSRCDECHVDEVAKKKFMGHSLGKLGQAYTDLSDKYYIDEANKLFYNI